ncbi:heat shock protein 70 family protein, partial [Kipferlia bialata]|eukprot:g680.t1
MLRDISAHIAKQYDDMMSIDNVKWCLTVPAMWTDQAKGQMREAALEAGLIHELDSPRLLLILEPEAAAVFSKTKGPAFQFKEGEIFMVVDAGGGTVDLTVHKMTIKDGEDALEEVCRGLGGTCGGTFVDASFREWVCDKLTPEQVDKAERERPKDMQSLYTAWDNAKKEVGREDTDDVYIPIPVGIYKSLPQEVQFRLEEEQDGYDTDLVLTDEDAKEIFEPTVQRIIALIRQMDARVQDEIRASVDTMLL